MKRNNETESVRTTKINIASDSKSASGFSGFMIPTDLNVGDTFRVSGWGNVTITRETKRTYAGEQNSSLCSILRDQGRRRSYHRYKILLGQRNRNLFGRNCKYRQIHHEF